MTTTNNYAFKKPGRKSLTSENAWYQVLKTLDTMRFALS